MYHYMTKDLELLDRQPNRFWQPQLKYKILTWSGILSKFVTCVGYTTSHFISVESIFRPVVAFKRFSSVRISLLPIICCTTSLLMYSSTCTVRLIFRWGQTLLKMKMVLIVTFSYKHVVHTKQTGWRGSASDLHSGGPWLKSQLGPLTLMTEVFAVTLTPFWPVPA